MIEVRSKSLNGLFEEAAKALSDFMVFVERVQPIKKKKIEVYGESNEDLLVSFLTELLSLFDSEGFIWRGCKVKTSEGKLTAEVFGEDYSQEKHGYKGYVKAITYHQIEIKRDEKGYYAKFLIDI